MKSHSKRITRDYLFLPLKETTPQSISQKFTVLCTEELSSLATQIAYNHYHSLKGYIVFQKQDLNIFKLLHVFPWEVYHLLYLIIYILKILLTSVYQRFVFFNITNMNICFIHTIYWLSQWMFNTEATYICPICNKYGH
jgi:hypothetical protein